MTPRDWLCERVCAHAGRRTLVVRHAGRAGDASDSTAHDCVAGLEVARDCPVDVRYDVAIVVEQLEAMAERERRYLLARLRDLVAPRVEVCVRDDFACCWPDNEWRALEFKPLGGFADEGTRYATFEYDLATYTSERSWNTPEHWANPGNFDRFRW